MSACASVTELNNSRPCQRVPWIWSDSRWLWRTLTAALLALVTILMTTATAQAAAPGPPHPACDVGAFCAWPGEDYAGVPHISDLRTTNLEECVPLGKGVEARSLINRTDRPVTVYQDS